MPIQVRHGGTGQVFDFPDGTDEQTIAGHFQAGQQAIAPQQPSVAQQFMSGLQQFAPQQQFQSTVPAPNGAGMIGLTPQQAQFSLQQNQQARQLESQQFQEQQRQQFRERELVARETEREKDRQGTIALQQQRFKNSQAAAKLVADQREAEEKARVIRDEESARVQANQNDRIQTRLEDSAQSRRDIALEGLALRRESNARAASGGGTAAKEPKIEFFNGIPMRYDFETKGWVEETSIPRQPPETKKSKDTFPSIFEKLRSAQNKAKADESLDEGEALTLAEMQSEARVIDNMSKGDPPFASEDVEERFYKSLLTQYERQGLSSQDSLNRANARMFGLHRIPFKTLPDGRPVPIVEQQ